MAAVVTEPKGVITTTTTGEGNLADCDIQAVTLQPHGQHQHSPLQSTTTRLATSTSTTTTTRISSNVNNNSSRSSVERAMQRCGICSLLSRLLRRAMCIGSRRGSGESYYQELPELPETNVSYFLIHLYLDHRNSLNIDAFTTSGLYFDAPKEPKHPTTNIKSKEKYENWLKYNCPFSKLFTLMEFIRPSAMIAVRLNLSHVGLGWVRSKTFPY